MDEQLTLRLPAELAKKLKLAAKRLQRRRSEVVRMALEQFLAVEVENRPIDRVRDLLGSLESGVPDLGQRNHEHLMKRIRRGG